MSGEIRQNKATKEWVIYAPARGKRPHDFQRQTEQRQALPSCDPKCPFCVGNDASLATIICEQAGPDHGMWQVRVVANKYPALTPDGAGERYAEGPYVAMQGYGHHEVIIESPRHDQDIATMPEQDVTAVLAMYKQRYVEHRQNPRNLLILIFRNHGQRAGASLIHPHSQIITTGMIPRNVRTREDEAQRYHDEWGRCVYCDIIAFEQTDRQRVVLENDSFIAFVPYAAEVPFETWIVPKRHQTDFVHISDVECDDLTHALRSVLGRFRTKLNDPDYNYVLNTSTRVTNEPQLHWYVRVRPRLVTRAGFEIGSGMRINPSLPEADAAFLNAEDNNQGQQAASSSAT
jgi:UDPglucose--hexose-1-phosphate uridylyltransferase